jgi:K+-transporting ATPase ATPase C chain
MSTITQSLRPAVSLFVVLTALTGLAYPIVVTGLSQAIAPDSANGSLLYQGDKVIGSKLIGQSFTNPAYLWSRPSATATTPYNGQASGGSNLGPLNPDLAKAVQERINKLHQVDPANTAVVPIDLVTASGSGLDPHITPNAAKYQAARIAALRGVTVNQVQTVIDKNTEGRQFGLFGEPRVNVLQVNIDLDQLAPLAAANTAVKVVKN